MSADRITAVWEIKSKTLQSCTHSFDYLANSLFGEQSSPNIVVLMENKDLRAAAGEKVIVHKTSASLWGRVINPAFNPPWPYVNP